MRVTVRSTRHASLPYSGFVMDAGADGTRPGIDISSLEVGGATASTGGTKSSAGRSGSTGTLLSIDGRRRRAPARNRRGRLAFEVKPRFGKATVQRVDVATLRSIEPL